MTSLRSILRALLAAVGVALLVAGLGVAVPAYGEDAFPAGLALGFGVLLFAAGGAAVGGAALLSGRSLGRGQRIALGLAGALAVGAFVLPTGGLFLAPELLVDLFDTQPLVAALVGWLYLTAGALLVGVVTVAWWGLEHAYAAVTAGS